MGITVARLKSHDYSAGKYFIGGRTPYNYTESIMLTRYTQKARTAFNNAVDIMTPDLVAAAR